MRFLAVSLLLLFPPVAYAIDLTIVPATPFPGDMILVTLTEECGTGYGRTFSYTATENVFTLIVEEIDCPCGEVCAAGCFPVEVSQTIGPLAAGEYTIKGVYRLIDGCTGEPVSEQVTEKVLTLAPPLPSPQLTFSFLPVCPHAGEEVRFRVQYLSNGEDQIVWYGWDWESDGVVDLAVQLVRTEQGPAYAWDYDLDGKPDKVTTALEEVKHRFSTPGTYRVTLRARNAQGLESWVGRDVLVRPVAFNAQLGISWEVISKDEKQLYVKLVATLPQAIPGLVYLWDWESDGEVDEVLPQPVTEHVFLLPGPFTVTLLARSPEGELVGVTRTLMVSE